MLVRINELRFILPSLPQNGRVLLNLPGFPSVAYSEENRRKLFTLFTPGATYALTVLGFTHPDGAHAGERTLSC